MISHEELKALLEDVEIDLERIFSEDWTADMKKFIEENRRRLDKSDEIG